MSNKSQEQKFIKGGEPPVRVERPRPKPTPTPPLKKSE